MPRKADGVLMGAIGDLLAWADDPDNGVGGVDLVAVSVGPGAFTGLRVGVSMALGIAFARGLLVSPVCSLMARAAMTDGERVLAVLDARKSRVYSGLYRVEDGVPEALSDPQDAAITHVMPVAPFVAVGEGAVIYGSQIEAGGGTVLSGAQRCPAVEVARLGRAFSKEARVPSEVALQYLRAPDARVPNKLGVALGVQER